ncbi:MAG TPA: DUF349 domain-containing protein, partial [Vicinamibacterales bacterium]|nr:DUF349 domain-containing protein [Vicinamibacterales bacterium]
MSFLDRFKIQPKHKSADPEIRVAGVAELGPSDEDTAALVALAREDAEVRVRRAAAARIEDVDVLAGLAAADADAGLREELLARLAAIAAGSDEASAARALAALTDPKQIGTVAKTSPAESVRTAAVGRLTDVKSLSSVARHAADPRTAALACDRIEDAAELLNIAAKTEHKDAGIGALERAVSLASPDRETLDGLAERAKNKSVAKRARAMVQAIDEAAAAEKAALEAHRQRVAGALARVEALAASTATAGAADQLREAEAEWAQLLETATHEIGAAERGRFQSAASASRAVLEREAQERAERERLEAELNAARLRRSEMCERIEAIHGDDALDRIAQARSEWEGLPADPEAAAHAAFMARFEDACRRAASRHENLQEAAKTNLRLDELSREAEQLAAQEDSPAYAWDAVSREWTALRGRSESLDEAVQQRYTAAETTIRERAEAKRLAAEKALRQQVQRVDQLIERVHKRAEAEDLTLKEADKAARDLRAAIETPLAVPHHEREYLVERLKAALGALAPKLHELREMDEWKRFANAAVQEELIAQAEALGKKYDLEKPDDMEKAARELHDIQERWKTAAEAPRAQAQTLWHRYRQAADPIQAKAREFFASRAAEREANLKIKLALCERAEALADSTDWIKTAEEMKKLQAEWQASGPVPRPETRAVWKRFRDACDRFFTRRNEDLAQ